MLGALHQAEPDVAYAYLEHAIREAADPTDVHRWPQRAAADCLSKIDALPNGWTPGDVVEQLGREVAKHAAAVVDAMDLDGASGAPQAWWTSKSADREMLWADAVLADYFRDHFGDPGDEAATWLADAARSAWREFAAAGIPLTPNWLLSPERDTGKEAFRRWIRPQEDGARPPKALRILAETAWRGGLREALEQDRFPAMPLGYQRAQARAAFAPGRRIETDRDGRAVIVSPRHGTVGVLEGSDCVAMPGAVVGATALGALSTLTGQELCRWIPHRARELAITDAMDLRRVAPIIEVEGGLTALAVKIGAGPGHTRELRNALDALRYVRVLDDDTGTLYHGLLTWSEERASRGKRARVVIQPSRALFNGPRGKLVPVVHGLPRFAGSRNSWGAQVALQSLVVEELRANGMELAQAGDVRITSRRWRELGELVGLSDRTIRSLLDDVWVTDGEDGPAFLVRRAPDRWTLSDAYAAEREFLTEGGRYDLGQSRRGRVSAARRHRKALAAGGAATGGGKGQ